MSRWRSWIGALVTAQLMAAPLHAQEAAVPGAAKDGGVWVELHADDAVRIERVQNGEAVPVCAAPCRQKLARDDVYRIGGVGVMPSQKFDLSKSPGTVRLDVKAGSTAQRSAGVTLGLLGGLTFVAAGLYWLNNGLGYELDGPPPTHRQTLIADTGLISGVAMGALGLILALTSGTEVRTSNGATFSSAPAAPRRKRPAIVLTPRGLEF